MDTLIQVKDYLLPQERKMGLHQLQPASKRSAYMLVFALASGNNPLPEWKSYYDFGYAACRDGDQCQLLGGTYRAILNECDNKPAGLIKIYKAFDNNALMSLIDDHGYSLIRRDIPDLERYLSTKEHDKETIWKLVQFIRAKDKTDAPKSLLGGYRFDYAKGREDVQILKDLYANMLNTMHPLRLHEACNEGRLLQTAIQAVNVPLHKAVHRMLRSRTLVPGEAYEGTSMTPVGGPGGVFRKRQKWTETYQYGS
jgi:hypothetical protein